MASQGRSIVANKPGICEHWEPTDLWSNPPSDSYQDIAEVDFRRYVAGIVDAIEAADLWHNFKIEAVPGQAPSKGSE